MTPHDPLSDLDVFRGQFADLPLRQSVFPHHSPSDRMALARLATYGDRPAQDDVAGYHSSYQPLQAPVRRKGLLCVLLRSLVIRHSDRAQA